MLVVKNIQPEAAFTLKKLEQAVLVHRAGSSSQKVLISLDEGAILEHIIIAEPAQGEKNYHVNVEQKRDSTYKCTLVSLGAGEKDEVHYNIDVNLLGENADCNLQAVYALKDDVKVHFKTKISHQASHTKSTQKYKGIIAGNALAVFDGTIDIKPHAQKTHSAQSNKNLLLEKGRIQTKPTLTISADDVKCSHGATIGQMDEEALFYLQSRGIPSSSARKMLTHAFLQEIISTISQKEIIQEVEKNLWDNFESQVNIL
ncbi:MAG: SufD family Fe-S cluster assembly protein [Bacteriovoracaceae bacterium]|nr:SufD family Fe-S cluster assembly protein [Bacteriovoracaceae bacterium]